MLKPVEYLTPVLAKKRIPSSGSPACSDSACMYRSAFGASASVGRATVGGVLMSVGSYLPRGWTGVNGIL